MSKRKTTEQFKNEVYDLVGDEYVINGEYINANTKIGIIHNRQGCMHSFDIRPANFLTGQRCPKCRFQKISSHNRKTQDQFEKEIYDLVENEYKVESAYVNNHTKITFRHNVCGTVFDMTPGHFLSGQRCTNKECLHSRWFSACMNDQSFNNFFKEYSGLYEMLGEYKGYKNNITFKHKECGHIFDRSPNNFVVLGDRCPKCTTVIYKGENKIESFLIDNNIDFKQQKTYEDLLGINNGFLSYDFYLPEYNLLIEFQGEQHEYPIKHFGGNEKFEVQQEHDRRKRQYAKDHGIDLLEIWYWDYDRIEEIIENCLKLYIQKCG